MRGLFLLSLLGGAVLAATPVAAAGPPEFVVPGRPDVPVFINGIDASWCVVEGNWGLDRPGAVSPAVTCAVPVVGERGGPKSFFPLTGRRPRVGRLEIRPRARRVLPRPAESFYRVWTAAPERLPTTEYPAFGTPEIMVAPNMPQASPNSPRRSHR